MVKNLKNKTLSVVLVTALFYSFMVFFSGCNKDTTDVVIKTDTIPSIVVSEDTVIVGTIEYMVYGCPGYCWVISVENIPDFGQTGSFSYYSGDVNEYHNAIQIPLSFGKNVEGTDKIPRDNDNYLLIGIGDTITFECRHATEDDASLFYYDNPNPCKDDYLPVTAPPYMMTKIIDYQKP